MIIIQAILTTDQESSFCTPLRRRPEGTF